MGYKPWWRAAATCCLCLPALAFLCLPTYLLPPTYLSYLPPLFLPTILYTLQDVPTLDIIACTHTPLPLSLLAHHGTGTWGCLVLALLAPLLLSLSVYYLGLSCVTCIILPLILL